MLYTMYPNHCTPSSTMEFRKYHTVSLSKQFAVLLTHKYPLSTKYFSSIKNFSYILLIVIATSCDIELNPGSCNVKYPCGTCVKPVTWQQKGIRCDNSDCEQWYHIDCRNMHPNIYDNINSSGCIWECYKCALPNFSSSLFDLHSVSTSTSYSILDSTTEDSQEILSPGLPLASSSPNKRIPKYKPKASKPLRILNVNCQSIVNKTADFEWLLDSTNADVVFGTESWLRNDIKVHEVFPDVCTTYRKDRNEGRGGDVFIAVKDEYVSSHVTDMDTECEILWVKMEVSSGKNVYLASYCRPHVSDQESLTQLTESLDKLPNSNSHVILAGDMNLPGINWPSGNVTENCQSANLHEQFLEIIADHGLVQVTDKPTRDENTLDLITVNNPTLLNRLEVIPGISDHDAVFAELDISPRKYNQKKWKILIYRKANWEKISEEIQKSHKVIEDNKETSDIDTLWNTFKSSLLKAIEKFVPHRTASSRDRPPWITPKIKKLIQSRDHLFKKNTTKPKTSRKEKLKTFEKTI